MPEEEKEEYELIPVSPLRKLEKRIEELEASRAAVDMREFLKEIVDIIKMNQSLVNELARANDALRLEMAKLPPKMDELIKGVNELISYIKAAAVEELPPAKEIPGETLKALLEKMNEVSEGNKKIVEVTQAVASALEELNKRFRAPPKIVRPPLPPRRRVV